MQLYFGMARRSGGRAGVCVVVAGRHASGKTTALNNLFGLELPLGRSCRTSGKSMFDQVRVTMNDVGLLVIDTPGLETLNAEGQEVAGNVIRTIQAEKYTLVYCLSATGDLRLTDVDRAIVRNLHAVLGAEAWSKSIVLFTFADSLRQDRFSSRSKNRDYKEHLQALARDFHQTLQECHPGLPTLKTVFQLAEDAGADCVPGIVALPVGRRVEWSDDPPILPDVFPPKEDWTDLVFAHFLDKTPSDKRVPFVALKYGPAVAREALSQASCADTSLVGNTEEGAVGQSRVASSSSSCWWDEAGTSLAVRDVIAAVKATRNKDL